MMPVTAVLRSVVFGDEFPKHQSSRGKQQFLKLAGTDGSKGEASAFKPSMPASVRLTGIGMI